ncbi:MAG: hypothetical protein ABRQ24_00610 [Syntrophomonadaceae bacterium]
MTEVESEAGAWASLIARLCLIGFTPREVARFTVAQGEAILQAANEEFKLQARLAGATFEDDQEVEELTFEEAFEKLQQQLG